MFNFKKKKQNGGEVSEKDVDLVEEVKEEKTPNVPFFKLFKFATPKDKVIIGLATLAATINGLSQPFLFLLFSQIIGLFGDYQKNYPINPDLANSTLKEAIDFLCIMFVVAGSITAVAAYFQLSLWLMVGESQAVRIRNKYYHSVLSQEMGWFDSISSGDIASRIAGDINMVQDGISDKVGMLVQYITCFIGAFVIAFIKGWKLTLVMLTSVPLMAFAGMLMSKVIADASKGGQGVYGEAGSIAEEVLSAIKTIYSFNTQEKEQIRYEQKLRVARKKGFRKAFFTGLSNGVFLLIMFSSYALAMWYGGKLIRDGEQEAGDVLTVFFNVLIGSMVLGMTSPSLTAVATAQGAATKLFEIIERESSIDPFLITDEHLKNESKISPVKGNIKFENVQFSYPSRLDVQILKGISFEASKGQTVALVGHSGSGKSTCISLIERFYTPTSGKILLDDMDISEISNKFLKEHVGLVGQEPCLFGTTIKQNILFGLKNDDEFKADAKQLHDRVVNACKLANIHDFIMKLPQQYDTMVGDRGSQLSGGQKQRIAIARAIIKDPTILLLDEATSALDTESERIVQKALDNAAKDRTTIVIAHRLSTIKKADKIVVFDKGTIIEEGSHNELLALNGAYANLVKQQEIRKGDEEEKTKDDTVVIDDVKEEEEVVLDIDDIKELDEGLFRMTSRVKTLPKELAERKKKKEKVPMPLMRCLKMIAPHWHFGLIGSLGALLDGVSFPIYAILLTEATQSFFDLGVPELVEKGQEDINFWSLMFLILAIGCLIAGFMRYAGYNTLGEHLTYEIRRRCFRSLLTQEVGFYDAPENSVGIISGKLSTEAENVQGLVGKFMGPIFSAFSCTVASLIIAFLNGWKLTLVALATVPLNAYGQLVEVSALTDVNEKTKHAYLKVSQIAMESIINKRTVSSLNRENLFFEDYLERVEKAHRISKRGYLKSAIGYSFAMGIPHFVNALVFWYGTTLFISQEYTYTNMFQVITSVMFMGMSFGFASSELISLVKSKIAANDIFELLDRTPKIDQSDAYGNKNKQLYGDVLSENARFAYPSRPDVTVLNGLDLEVLRDKKVALVGSSGSGKSTIIGLIQMFYTLNSGKLEVEGQDISEWNVPYLRSQLSTVGQEPVLFNISVMDNIAYGAERDVTKEEIIHVAKMANAHDFIMDLPDGYNTSCGERGGRLSGGQKQRVAIARALIRNPKLLLLDEATSALDSQSEKVVQDALDKASEGRTTITIAHRLSTIQDADIIIVMKNGKKVEMGTHDELLALNGFYTSLVQNQSLGSN